MATPTTNFGFSSLNTEILQRTSTTAISLNDAAVRLGYGATSQVSLSDLRRAYGATITSVREENKFYTATGYNSGIPIGSVDDDTISASSPVQTLYGAFTIFGSPNQSFITLGADPATPFQANQVIRAATANTVRTITANTNNTEFQISSYVFPDSGTVTIGLKFAV